MERFLSITLGLMGTTPLEMVRMDMYHASWTDMMSMFMWKVWRAPSDELKRRGASDFWIEFPKFLKKHDLILKSSEGPFYSGSRVRLYILILYSLGECFADLINFKLQLSLPDIYAFTWLNRFITKWIPSPPDVITESNYPHILALWKGVRESEGIKKYIESKRWELLE